MARGTEMSKNKLRKITVDDHSYLWKREHFHLTEFEHSECVEKVTIYREGFKNSPLQLLFREEDNLTLKANPEEEKWCVGYPDDGVIWLFKSKTAAVHINLNRPAVIAGLIQYFVQTDWHPEENKKALVMEDALKFLDLLDLPKGINK